MSHSIHNDTTHDYIMIHDTYQLGWNWSVTCSPRSFRATRFNVSTSQHRESETPSAAEVTDAVLPPSGAKHMLSQPASNAEVLGFSVNFSVIPHHLGPLGRGWRAVLPVTGVLLNIIKQTWLAGNYSRFLGDVPIFIGEWNTIWCHQTLLGDPVSKWRFRSLGNSSILMVDFPLHAMELMTLEGKQPWFRGCV